MFITWMILSIIVMVVLAIGSYKIGYTDGFKNGATKAFDESLKATEEMLRNKGIIN